MHRIHSIKDVMLKCIDHLVMSGMDIVGHSHASMKVGCLNHLAGVSCCWCTGGSHRHWAFTRVAWMMLPVLRLCCHRSSHRVPIVGHVSVVRNLNVAITVCWMGFVTLSNVWAQVHRRCDWCRKSTLRFIDWKARHLQIAVILRSW